MNLEDIYVDLMLFVFFTAPLAAGIVTIFESVEIEQELSGKRWLLIYIINSAAIFTINILLVLNFRAVDELLNGERMNSKIFVHPARTAISILIVEIIFIIGIILIKKLIKGSFTILPQNERNVNMLGKFIKEHREKLGMSCSELARCSGHPVSSIHGIETGANKNPRFQIIIDIASVLGTSLEEMKKAFENEQDEV